MVRTKTTISAVLAGSAIMLALALQGCSTMKSVFALDKEPKPVGPIENPFQGYSEESNKENMVLRTKKGDRSVEVELPASATENTDLYVPVSPAFRDENRAPASEGGIIDEHYRDRKPSMTDREIAQDLPHGSGPDDASRREIETSLGVTEAADSTPATDSSYLASLDHIKQLYRASRFEAALMESDDMIREYPTDPKLYEMRGTLLDRMGHTDLAIKSWNQSLRFDPSNVALKRYMEKKLQKRSLASP